MALKKASEKQTEKRGKNMYTKFFALGAVAAAIFWALTMLGEFVELKGYDLGMVLLKLVQFGAMLVSQWLAMMLAMFLTCISVAFLTSEPSESADGRLFTKVIGFCTPFALLWCGYWFLYLINQPTLSEEQWVKVIGFGVGLFGTGLGTVKGFLGLWYQPRPE